MSVVREAVQASDAALVEGETNGEVNQGMLQKDGGELVQAFPEEVRVDGTTQLGLIDFGGKRPTAAVITLTGGQFDLVDGKAFEKGDVVTGTFTAVVYDVGGRDKTDPKTGIVVSCTQRHSARIVDLTVKGAA